MESIILAALGIFGTLGGTALGQWMATRSKTMELEYLRKKEQRESLLVGLRELHLAVIEYNIGLGSFVPKVLGARENLTSTSARVPFDSTEALLTPIVQPWAKMGSLQLLYANELGGEWHKVGDKYDALVGATMSFLNGEFGVSDFVKAVHELSDQAIEFVGILTDKYLFISGDPIVRARLSAVRDANVGDTPHGERAE